jgi:hypothetical protein
MNKFYTSIVLYSLLVVGLAVGISCLVILNPLKKDIAQISQDQTALKQELTTNLTEIKQTLETTNVKLDNRGGLPTPLTDATPIATSSTDSLAAKRLARINAAIDSTLHDLDTPESPGAIGGLERQLTINSPSWRTIEVYESPNPSALTVGTMRYGTDYPLKDTQPTAADPEWYQTALPDGTLGWVMATYVKEIN